MVIDNFGGLHAFKSCFVFGQSAVYNLLKQNFGTWLYYKVRTRICPRLCSTESLVVSNTMTSHSGSYLHVQSNYSQL